jgi:hypothetical protein
VLPDDGAAIVPLRSGTVLVYASEVALPRSCDLGARRGRRARVVVGAFLAVGQCRRRPFLLGRRLERLCRGDVALLVQRSHQGIGQGDTDDGPDDGCPPRRIGAPAATVATPATSRTISIVRRGALLIGGLLERIIYLNIGVSVILAFIGVKLIIEALHGSNVDAIGPMHLPEIGIAASVGFVIVTLAVTTVSSLGKSSYHRRQLQANPVRSAELVPANDQQADAVGT